MLGTVGTIGIQLHAAITTLSALPAGASLGAMLSPITAIASIGLTLFSMFQKPDCSLQLMLEQIHKQLQQISEQIQNLHIDMRKHFEVVFRYLDDIVNSLEKHHYELVNISNQIERLSINASKYNANAEYFLNGIYLQKFKSALYQITKGNDHANDYNNFRSLFMDMFESLDQYSFDRGCNGYIRAINPNDHGSLSFPAQHVREVLAAPVEYRLGYLAALIGFPDAEKMMIPNMFSDSTDGIILLIERYLKYYGTLPIDNFNRSLNNIIANARFTEQFISFSKTPDVVNRVFQSYRQSINNLSNVITSWHNASRARFNIDCMQTVDQLHNQMDLWNGRANASPTPGNHSAYPAFSGGLPIGYIESIVNLNPNILRMLKYATLLEKLEMGKLEVLYSAQAGSHWNIFGNEITVSCTITFNTAKQEKLAIAQHSWSTRKHLHNDHEWNWNRDGKLPHECMSTNVFNQLWSNHIKAPSTAYTQEMEAEARNVALSKLREVRSELNTLNNPFGIQVDELCAEIQKNYVTLKALNELHGVQTRVVSGDQIRAMLNNFAEQGGLSTINIVAQISEVARSTITPTYSEQNAILARIGATLEKLAALPTKVEEIIENYNENERIKKQLRIAEEAEQKRIELEQREILNKKIDEIAHAEGMIRTKELMINFLISNGKNLEAKLLNEELNYISQGTIDGEISRQYKTSFIAGSNFALNQAVLVLFKHQYGVAGIFLLEKGTQGIEGMRGSSRLLEAIFQPTITSLSNAYSTSSSGIPSASSLSNPSWNSLPLDNTALRQQQQSMILFRNPFSAEEESEYNCDDDEVIEALEPEQKRHRPNL